LRRVAVLGLLLVLAGCSSAVKQTASFQNRYDFRLNRYLETCQVLTPPVACTAKQAALKVYEKALHEAATAVKWGGSLPLQMQALKAADKEAAK
jgi:hypothetical protein